MTDYRILGLGLAMALGACAQGGNDRANAPAEELTSTCAAKDHQDWIGQRVDILNDIDLPEGTRVLFPTTPATMDYRPERMNVAVGKDDVIERVFCS